MIKVENISKKYIIGHHKQENYVTLRDKISNGVQSLTQRIFQPHHKIVDQVHEEFWALDDVSFEVKRGEVIGIIGRNGAGKSTLLKILSRITEPTKGSMRLKGRVASLLEVGTGFHNELTGRENIFLNGAILGMSKQEIIMKFDEIVAFAEIEKFIDTPVKHYSSGMYVRLAFAVAANLEPEILIVDEVLAVGDAAFQKKCLGKMGEVSTKEGRTVLFVSHNLQAVQNLCSVGLVLEQGKVIEHSDIDTSIKTYMSLWHKGEVGSNLNLKDRLSRCSGDVRFTSVIVQDENKDTKWEFQEGNTIKVQFFYQVFKSVDNLMVYFSLTSPINDQIITNCKHTISEQELLPGHVERVVIDIPNICLRPGTYGLYIVLGNTANPYTPYDVLDNNVSLPFITITSNETDPHKRIGYFSINSIMSLSQP
ncbi:MAG: ATP-binding cassette domain-containing protein [Microcystis sp. M046S1]|nr:ATP-binding cassette domain-containing protein [Microcystis sp. M046S1]